MVSEPRSAVRIASAEDSKQLDILAHKLISIV